MKINLLMLTMLSAAILSCQKSTGARTPLPGGDDLTYVSMPDSVSSVMIDYPGFTVSFNPDHGIPNYVAWELTAAETSGSAKRTNNFRQDENVGRCPVPADYRNTGFDRGHMAPAADFKWSDEAMKATHYLTNICPQHHDLNRGAWNTVEQNCRTWARRDSALIIICGPVLTVKPLAHIGLNSVTVPGKFFKVVIAPYAMPPRAIAFLMDNTYIEGGAQKTVTTVDEVERLTGFDFFSSLPDEIEQSIESESRYHQWQKKSK